MNESKKNIETPLLNTLKRKAVALDKQVGFIFTFS